MKKRSKLRRQPNGRPEYRSVDDMLKEAAAQAKQADKGRPIDLGDYFSSSAETRIGNRLLKDNEVLPQPLQERKDAERLRQQAEAHLQRETARLAAERDRIAREASGLTACFPDRDTLLGLLDIDTWPAYLPEPGRDDLPPMSDWLETARSLQGRVTTYNRQVEVALSQYLHLLEGANACVERLNIQVAFSPHLAAQLQMQKHDTAQRRQAVGAQLPCLPPLPRDLPERLAQYHRNCKPGCWQRLKARFSTP